MHYFKRLVALVALLSLPCTAADVLPVNDGNHDKHSLEDIKVGIEIGALTFIGADFRLSFNKTNTPWVFGIRYLDIDDDFVNEGAAGFPDDESDRRYTARSGIFTEYSFSHTGFRSFYLSGALYNTNVKIECENETDSESISSLYFGGGFQGKLSNRFGYKIGLLLSPFVNTKLETAYCSEETSGDIDLNASLTYTFN